MSNPLGCWHLASTKQIADLPFPPLPTPQALCWARRSGQGTHLGGSQQWGCPDSLLWLTRSKQSSVELWLGRLDIPKAFLPFLISILQDPDLSLYIYFAPTGQSWPKSVTWEYQLSFLPDIIAMISQRRERVLLSWQERATGKKDKITKNTLRTFR